MKKSKLFYGWIIVIVVAFTLFFSSPGQTYSVSIFIDYYIEQFGWSRAEISSFYSIATLISGFSMPFIGRIIDTKGHRKSAVIISFLFGLTLIWMSAVNAPWMIFLGFIFIRMFGQGSLSLIPSVLIPQWFIRKRGRALSLISIGGVIGSAVVPPLNNYLISNFGLTRAWIFWAAAMVTVMLPIAFFLIRNRPEDIGMLPDGLRSEADKPGIESSPGDLERSEELERSWTLKEAKGTRAFWLMLLASMVPSLVNTGITFHMISIISGKGYDAGFGAMILSFTALSQIPMTFLAGFVLDKVKVNLVKGFNFILFAIIMVLLNYAGGSALLIAYAMLHGTFMAFDSVSTGMLWSNYFGRKHLGKIRGLAVSFMVLGSALGPLPFGAAFDYFGGYQEILLFSIILPVLASLASFLSPAPVHKDDAVAKG